ncbi:polysaccharide deacetylase family protein [Gilvimarinus agarilyticus]|uniref:polysaccharide deacetylase family protein n=1 Tax=Gilvimarinus sp. 2_MG-2023 TaxID=3062666 RepID=UPI001C08FEB8|nr:polysaccharide deacetylase family protein [Gilvimarinus sp. 2_MG-2023]MBU2886575.1 polysaccharide deacetylase family protein [Gilvimarinus agarilyticus]MDO6571243.1 polysaccharide deacetylase family protein [Gilvimarinus sp. 2_MG-2023]
MKTTLITLAILFGLSSAQAVETYPWPAGQKTAISLSYDDSLNSQLDNAIPALNQYNFKGSFYLNLSASVTYDRLTEWRQAAADGHELGNHTIYHACSKSQPGTDWVKAYNDIDKRTVEQMRDEILVANAFLHAIDGKQGRTFTPPCGHTETANGNYLPAVSDLFVSIKGSEQPQPKNFTQVFLPHGQSGAELIGMVEAASAEYALVQLIFHGIGGDHLSVSDQTHRELLAYFDKNKQDYWVDTYINIMQHVQKNLP